MGCGEMDVGICFIRYDVLEPGAVIVVVVSAGVGNLPRRSCFITFPQISLALRTMEYICQASKAMRCDYGTAASEQAQA